MSRARARCLRIEERAVRIGLGIKRASQGQERLPQLLALEPPLDGAQAIPIRPLGPDDVLRANHPLKLAHCGRRGNKTAHLPLVVVDRGGGEVLLHSLVGRHLSGGAAGTP